MMPISNIPKALEHNIELNKLILEEWQKLQEKDRAMAIKMVEDQFKKEEQLIQGRKIERQNRQLGPDERETQESDDRKAIDEQIQQNLFLEAKKHLEKIKNNCFQFQENWWELYLEYNRHYKLPINQALLKQCGRQKNQQKASKKTQKKKKIIDTDQYQVSKCSYKTKFIKKNHQ